MSLQLWKKAVLILTALWAAVALLAVFCEEETAALFSVEVTSPAGYESIDCWESEEGEYFVFLPSFADPAKTSIRRNRGEEIVIDGQPLRDGMTCEPFQLNVPYALSWKGKESTITFLQSENVPALYLDTRSGNMDYIHADKKNDESGYLCLYTSQGDVNYTGKASKIEGRGNSTWTREKKPYNITLSLPGDLLGMGTAQNWVLLANYYDATNLKNKIVLDYSQDVGLQYTPQGKFVDLYLNGEYAGLYLLCERNEVHPQRVDLTAPENFLLSTDYSERLQRQGKPYVETDHLSPVFALRIRNSTVTEGTMKEIFQSAENAILSEDGVDPVTGKNWQDLIDLDSWARKYLVEEIFANVDGGRVSQFYYWNGGKIYAGPVWDYDLTMGVSLPWDTFHYVPEMFYANRPGEDGAAWFCALYQKQEFYDRVTELYQEEFQPLLAEFIETEITQYTAEIAASADMNAIRWAAGDFSAAVENLQEYLSKRMDFLDAVWTRNEEYCTVRVHRENEVPLCYAVRPGTQMTELPETVNMSEAVYTGTWYLAGTGEPFDAKQPIYEDTDVYFRKASVEAGSQEDSRESNLHIWTRRGFNAAFLAIFLGMAFVDFQKNKMNRRRSHG